MSERRREMRRRTYLAGQLAFNDRYSTMDCLVRNLSQDGAKLTFAHPPMIPSEFDLTVVKKGDSRRARVVWQVDLEAGVAFLGTDPDTGVVVSLAEMRSRRDMEKWDAEQGETD